MLRSLLCSLLIASFAAHAYAQESASLDRRLTLSLGGYRFHDAGYEPTPRVELAADLLRLNGAGLDLGAALSWSRIGYRAGEQYRDCNDCLPEYDFTGHGFGGRLYAELAKAPIPIRFSLGLAHHIGRGDFDSTDASYFEIEDFTRRVTSTEFGLGLAWPLHPRFEVAADARLYRRLGWSFGSNPHFSMSLGMGVRL